MSNHEKEIGRQLISSYVGGHKLIRILGDKPSLKIAKQKAKTFLISSLLKRVINLYFLRIYWT